LHDFFGLADGGLHEEGFELGWGGGGEKGGLLGPFDELGLDFLDLGEDLVFDEGVEVVDVEAAGGEGVLVGSIRVVSLD
jgi:hypothetical protein